MNCFVCFGQRFGVGFNCVNFFEKFQLFMCRGTLDNFITGNPPGVCAPAPLFRYPVGYVTIVMVLMMMSMMMVHVSIVLDGMPHRRRYSMSRFNGVRAVTVPLNVAWVAANIIVGTRPGEIKVGDFLPGALSKTTKPRDA